MGDIEVWVGVDLRRRRYVLFSLTARNGAGAKAEAEERKARRRVRRKDRIWISRLKIGLDLGLCAKGIALDGTDTFGPRFPPAL